MKKFKSKFQYLFLFLPIIISSCETEGGPPTKTSMEGVWEVTQAFNEQGDDITDKIKFPVTAFHLSSDNTVVSTGGPMFMYLVYGDNKYTEIASKIDQVFNYAGLDFNGGEFFIGGGEQQRFTLELKLEGLPGQKTLTTLLDLLGVTNDFLDLVIYHKFQDVKISFEDNQSTMLWEFDDKTAAIYNTKDNHGNYVLWEGWPVSNFSKCHFILKRKGKDLQKVVEENI